MTKTKTEKNLRLKTFVLITIFSCLFVLQDQVVKAHAENYKTYFETNYSWLDRTISDGTGDNGGTAVNVHATVIRVTEHREGLTECFEAENLGHKYLLKTKKLNGLPINSQDIKFEILAQLQDYPISTSTALSIANCESTFNHLAKSNVSTAKGTYQFLDGTWANYCQGDVYDYEANINCFMELYPKHPTWWECHSLIFS